MKDENPGKGEIWSLKDENPVIERRKSVENPVTDENPVKDETRS